MVKMINRYESTYQKRRRKQKEKAIQMYKDLEGKISTKLELYAVIEKAVGLSVNTIKRDLKKEGII